MSIQERINNFDIQGSIRRESSRGLWDEMKYLCHGLLSEVTEDETVIVYKLIREEDNLIVQKILGWNGEVLKFQDEPGEPCVFMRNEDDKPFYIVGDKILVRVVR